MAKAASKSAPAASSGKTQMKQNNVETYVFDGDIHNAPSWVDRGWAAFDAGPALAVPNGDPNGQPYTTTVARKGDTVLRHPAAGNLTYDTYKVVRAEEMGGQPGGDPVDPASPSFRPAQETNASLEDMAKTGILEEGVDPDAEAQLEARRNTAPVMSDEERKAQEQINLDRENQDQGGAAKEPASGRDTKRSRTST